MKLFHIFTFILLINFSLKSQNNTTFRFYEADHGHVSNEPIPTSEESKSIYEELTDKIKKLEENKSLLETEISKRDQIISDLNRQLSDSNEELRFKNEELERRESKITNLEQKLSSRDKLILKLIEELTNVTEDWRDNVNEFYGKINSKDSIIIYQNVALSTLEIKLNKAKKELALFPSYTFDHHLKFIEKVGKEFRYQLVFSGNFTNTESYVLHKNEDAQNEDFKLKLFAELASLRGKSRKELNYIEVEHMDESKKKKVELGSSRHEEIKLWFSCRENLNRYIEVIPIVDFFLAKAGNKVDPLFKIEHLSFKPD